jgi:hypothetical protein
MAAPPALACVDSRLDLMMNCSKTTSPEPRKQRHGDLPKEPGCRLLDTSPSWARPLRTPSRPP